jgi:hypothetical protein
MRWTGSLVLALFGLCLELGCAGSRSTPPGYAGDDARDFVRTHRAELQKEIDTGSGPRLYDLAILAGCQDVFLLNRRLHRNQEKFFAVSGEGAASAAPVSDAEVGERVVRFLTDAPELRCLYLDTSREGSMFVAGRRDIGPTRQQVYQRGGTP